MAIGVAANRLELLQIADAVAREKSIDRRIVITAMEDAIAKAARSRYGSETEVHAEIDAKTGELRLARHMAVVEMVENSSNQISLEDARRRHPAAQIGESNGAVLVQHWVLGCDEILATRTENIFQSDYVVNLRRLDQCIGRGLRRLESLL